MTSGKLRPNIWYRKRNITSFIFPSKNAEASGDSLYHQIVCPYYMPVYKLFVFDRDIYS